MRLQLYWPDSGRPEPEPEPEPLLSYWCCPAASQRPPRISVPVRPVAFFSTDCPTAAATTNQWIIVPVGFDDIGRHAMAAEEGVRVVAAAVAPTTAPCVRPIDPARGDWRHALTAGSRSLATSHSTPPVHTHTPCQSVTQSVQPGSHPSLPPPPPPHHHHHHHRQPRHLARMSGVPTYPARRGRGSLQPVRNRGVYLPLWQRITHSQPSSARRRSRRDVGMMYTR